MSLTSVSLSFLSCETTANFSKTFPIYLLEVVEATYEASKPLAQIAEQNMQELEVETTVEFNDNEATSSEQRDIVPEGLYLIYAPCKKKLFLNSFRLFLLIYCIKIILKKF